MILAEVIVAILAGGRAVRLGELTAQLPKSLVTVAGRPFVDHQLELLYRRGVRKVHFCLGHLGQQVVDHVGDGARYGIAVTYSFDGPTLLGTGGALRVASPWLGEVFWTFYGDSYLDFDYGALQDAFTAQPAPALMTVFRNEGRWDTSNVEYRQGRVVRYDKQRPTEDMAYIDYGVSIFRKAVLERVPPDAQYDLGALQGDLAMSGALAGYEVVNRFYEVGSVAGIKDLEAHLRHRADGASDGDLER